MREIKFRAWDKFNGEMYVSSNYEDLSKFFLLIEHAIDGGNKVELMQFTGLIDKNGKEIYEGDILKCSWLAELGITEIDCEANGIVEWHLDNPCFYVHLIKPYKTGVASEMVYEETDLELFTDGYNDNYSYEIIGNIYENPELLK